MKILSLTKLEALRKNAGLSKKDLAERAGISPAAITHLFSRRDTSPTLRTLSGLSEALGCEIADLLEDECDAEEDRTAA